VERFAVAEFPQSGVGKCSLYGGIFDLADAFERLKRTNVESQCRTICVAKMAVDECIAPRDHMRPNDQPKFFRAAECW
jgi:hypothetical protein